MKKIFYTSFNVWNKLKNKNDYFFISTAFTTPKYYNGLCYPKLIPSKELFFKTHKEGYEPHNFFNAYYKEISKYKKSDLINELNNLSDKPICLLGWEEIGVFGECQFIISWFYNIKKSDALEFELTRNLIKENTYFFNL